MNDRAADRGDPAPDERPDLRLVLPAVAAWLVAWQGRGLPPVPVLLVSLLAAALAPVVLARVSGRWAAVTAAVLLCAAAAGVSTAARTQGRSEGPVAGLAARAAAVTVVAVVVDDPRLAAPKPGRGPFALVRLRVEQVQAGGVRTQVRTPVLLLSSDTAWLPLLPSQRVRAEGRLQPVEPGDDVAAVLSGRGPPQVLTAPSRVQRVRATCEPGCAPRWRRCQARRPACSPVWSSATPAGWTRSCAPTSRPWG